jgi:hypothetical protein
MLGLKLTVKIQKTKKQIIIMYCWLSTGTKYSELDIVYYFLIFKLWLLKTPEITLFFFILIHQLTIFFSQKISTSHPDPEVGTRTNTYTCTMVKYPLFLGML